MNLLTKHLSKQLLAVVAILATVLLLGYFYSDIKSFANTQISRTIISNPDLERGLVGHWTFDGNLDTRITDESGNGNHGSISGSATATMQTVGKIGQGLEFDGSDDYVLPSTNFQATGPTTLAAWILPNTISKSQVIIGRVSNSFFSSHGWHLTISGSDGELFAIQASNNSEWATNLRSPNPLEADTWQHVAVTFSDCCSVTATGTLYINGEQVAQHTGTTNSYFGYTFTIGTNLSGSTPLSASFDGVIDDPRVYNRALSAEEVKRLYQLGATTKINKTIISNDSLDNGLVGHWTFDGNLDAQITDESGNGNHGSISGSATATMQTVGKIGQGLEFDGSDDYVEVPDSSSLDILDEITISLWVKVDSGGRDHFVSNGSFTDGTDGQYWFEMNTDETYELLLYEAGASGNANVTSAEKLSMNTWHHLVGTYDGATMKLYKDGVQDANTTATTITIRTDSTHNMDIGNRGTHHNIPTDGQIDDVRIYNRALSTQEVQRLYELGATTKINQTIISNNSLEIGLIGHWTFDGPDVTTAGILDRSGNDNHGGFVGGATSSALVPGKIGQAMVFDGSDDYTQGSMSALEVPLTICGWYKIDADSPLLQGGGGTEAIAMLRNTSGSAESFSIVLSKISSNDLRTRAQTRDNTSSYASAATGVTNLYSHGSVWHHVCGRFNAIDSRDVYLNGVFEASSTVSKNAQVAEHIIGAETNTSQTLEFFAFGIIDDVRIYNRALSAEEISRLYELGR